MVNINRDFDKSVRTTEITEELLNVEVKLLAGSAKKLESLDTRNSSSVEGEKLVAELNDYILHREVAGNELHISWVTIINWLLFFFRNIRNTNS